MFGRPLQLFINTLLAFQVTCLLSELSYGVSDGLRQLPFVQLGSAVAGDALATTLNIFSQPPLVIARLLGLQGEIPSLTNDQNIMDHANSIVEDFNIGLRNEDAQLNITELLVKYEREVEEHEVFTSDGYLLRVFRLPGEGPAVLLMHGILGSADDFVLAGPDRALAYMLADEGYDVWMGNARGNKYSRNHVDIDPSESVFWNFSWHEIGALDLPAMIDYILDYTKQASLNYIGHSQGTTVFFVMASEMPEYNEKINLMIALAPVAYVRNTKAPFMRILAPGTPLIHSLTKTLGLHELLPDNPLTRILRQLLCGTGIIADILCSNILFLMGGFSLDQLNVTNLPVVFSHEPGGASMKQLSHFGQGLVSGSFRKYDYNREENMKIYGTAVPPSYELDRISAPISLFYSDEDWLADPKDVDRLYNELPNAVEIHKIPHHPFNHFDFMFGNDVKTLVNDRILKLLKLYNKYVKSLVKHE